MKRLRLLCALLLALAFNTSVDAQSYFITGYKGFADAGYTIGIVDYQFGRVEINTSHGYQFSPYLFLGAGLGLHFMPSYKTNDSDIPLDVRDSKVDIPVFANIKVNFNKKKLAPFFDLKAGSYVTNDGGLYTNASLGIRYALNDKQGLSLSIGYSNEKLVFETFDHFTNSHNLDYTRDETLRNTQSVTIKLGVDF